MSLGILFRLCDVAAEPYHHGSICIGLQLCCVICMSNSVCVVMRGSGLMFHTVAMIILFSKHVRPLPDRGRDCLKWSTRQPHATHTSNLLTGYRQFGWEISSGNTQIWLGSLFTLVLVLTCALLRPTFCLHTRFQS